MKSSSVLRVAAVAAALVGSMSVGADIVPRDMLSGEPLFPRPEPSPFSGGSRVRRQGRAKPAGSKLARKAARGKL